MKKRNLKIFFRASFITAVVLFYIAAVFLGVCKSWEGIRQVSYGEETPAVEISEKGIRILDFQLKF